MDIIDLESRVKYLNPAGVTINVMDRIQLDIGLTNLNNSIECDELLFWGRINGLKADYFIAVAVFYEGKYEFPGKKFYWASNNDFKFAELPETLEQHHEFINKYNDFFTGDHTKILENLETPAGEGEGDQAAEENPEGEGEENNKDIDTESEDDEVKEPPKNLTELDRLAFVVKAIENDCQVIPMGSVKLTPLHEVRKNEAFKGLDHTNGFLEESYLHFRSAQIKDKKDLNQKDDAIFRSDFLESIADDEIQGSWSVQPDTTKSQVIIKSLLWPGYLAYHKLKSKIFGGVYIGDGTKNVDLPFML
uniref:Radial spoke head protein 9 homolog n=1 Tax=Euplotes crassus TaxID=5936 RepID=A0A7S3KNQ9_EUPCR|mmetsp:Transcript_34064/g.33609  ORF Transcript_34064/g.33609 Transcript_34064/m.33609 type:complete len:305 (+) Transcript_34064:21-935(+)|eukprot:CAMPEP_0196995972 /NCGR_PEP_ID=MMETSP1380-20130617/1971_1 /TAXON_ID=5936 /ORGANISM="Euplotes crassus, Strain CT5" /LENGTH=304 /DNA_ID=CAMNT_0042411799 /DNA_START=9 /DNA_END=923 /DNA_ORIENTATION=+